MKIAKITIILSLLVSTIFYGCKKGEEDPFFSFNTRKSRLKGTWILKSESGSGNIVPASGEPSVNITTTYDGITETTIYTGGADSTYTSRYSVEYVFGKDGEFRMTKIISSVNDPGVRTEISEGGTWRFLDEDKSNDIKNKEQILLIPESVILVSQEYPEGHFTSGGSPVIWSLIKLKDKEMKVSVYIEEYDTNTGYSYKMSKTFGMTSDGK